LGLTGPFSSRRFVQKGLRENVNKGGAGGTDSKGWKSGRLRIVLQELKMQRTTVGTFRFADGRTNFHNFVSTEREKKIGFHSGWGDRIL